MKEYYYIQGLRVIPKYFNNDHIDYKNIREQNYYTDKYAAEAEIREIRERLESLMNRLD